MSEHKPAKFGDNIYTLSWFKHIAFVILNITINQMKLGLTILVNYLSMTENKSSRSFENLPIRIITIIVNIGLTLSYIVL